MTDRTHGDLLAEYQSRLRAAMTRLTDLEGRLAEARRAVSEPIAIVGMACRFPGGASSPEALFELLARGEDAVTEAPAQRFAAASGAGRARALRWGGYLREDVAAFDAAYFGISPREAARIDPQQRLLLEVSCEALARAGLPDGQLHGARVGVYVGLTTNDYAAHSVTGDPDDVYALTGNGHCFAAGRLSYALGLQGPSMAVDTACSSSLVAVHLACQALRSDDCTVAIAAAVNLILSEDATAILARTQALSPGGRCKTFDASADGFVRGEGCGALVLKRLSAALRDGDPIRAVIRGSALSQDGRSTGITVPNVRAQQMAVSRALAAARVAPEQIGLVETHGTGTSLGDPLEIEALRAVFGAAPPGARCVLGAVKTHLGHLEAAAGMAGLIKAVMCLERGHVPRNLHFATLNPRIDLAGTPFVLASESCAWPAGDAPRRAGVSSFGLSGTNAHVVIEEPPRAPAGAASAAVASAAVAGATVADVVGSEAEGEVWRLVPVSGKTERAAGAAAERLATALTTGELAGARLADVAYTAGARSNHHAHRIAVRGRTPGEVAAALVAVARGEPGDGAWAGEVPRESRGLVFVFSGQGAQWLGMGQGLMRSVPAFRAAMAQIDELVQRHAGWSVIAQLAAPAGAARIDDTEVAQPALVAIQLALVAALAAWGVTPDAVVGHSLGEIAAAHTAGALDLAQAVALACVRGRIMQRATGHGAMAAVALDPAAAAQAIAGCADRVAVAAVNDPGSAVLSGEPGALERVLATLGERGIRTRRLAVNYAFHSPQMAGLADELAVALGDLTAGACALPMASTVTGGWLGPARLDAAYWARNVREPVAFAAAIGAALDGGERAFLEIGAHPVLSAHVAACAAERAIGDATVVATLRRGGDELAALLGAIGALHVGGHAVAWDRLAGAGRRVVALPAYPWQRERHWVDAAPRTETASAAPGARDGASPGPSGGAAGDPIAALRGASDAVLADQLALAGPLDARALAAVRRALAAIDARRIAAETAARVDDWLYAVRWRAQPANERRDAEPGHWLLLGGGALSEQLAHALAAHGASCARMAALSGAALAGARGVVDLRWAEPALDGELLAAALADLRALANQDVGPAPRIWYVTRNAVAVQPGARDPAIDAARDLATDAARDLVTDATRDLAIDAARDLATDAARVATDPVIDPARAAIWGLGRTAATEHPELWGGLIDIAPGPASIAALARELISGVSDEVALREDARFVARLAREAASGEPVRCDPEAVYVVIDAAEEASSGAAVGAAGGAAIARGAIDVPGAASSGAVIDAAGEASSGAVIDTAGEASSGAVIDAAGEASSGAAVRKGGGAAIARAVMGWLIERGARRVVLALPGDPDRDPVEAAGGNLAGNADAARGAPWFAEAQRRGCALSVVAAGTDRASRAAIERAAGGARIAGVIYLAGRARDGSLLALPPAQLTGDARRIARAVDSVLGWAGDAAFDLCVVIASAAAVLGMAGQGGAASAGAIVEAAVARARAAGRPAVAIAAGAWELASDPGLDKLRQRSAAHGVALVPPDAAGAIVDRATRAPASAVLALPIDWNGLAAITDRAQVPARLHELWPAESASGASRAPGASGAAPLAARVAEAPAGARAAIVLEHVQRTVERVLGISPPRRAHPQHGLFDLGLDSLMAIELKNRLQAAIGQALPPTVVFAHPTIAALAGFVQDALGGGPQPDEPADGRDAERALAEVAELTEQDLANLVDRELKALLGTGERGAAEPRSVR